MGVYRDRPTPSVDNQNGGGPSRAGRYSETYDLPISSKEVWAADEGSYNWAFSAIGTPIVGPVDANNTPTATKALMSVYNAGSNRIYPQLLRLYVTTVGTTGSRMNFSFALDPLTNRYSSGGTALTKNNVNSASINNSGATINFGALVTTAAGANVRQFGNLQPRGTIEVVEDCYEFNFAGAGGGTQSSSRAATVSEVSMTVPPLVIGPGDTMLLHFYRASITVGVTFEVNFGYIER
jgi:hypothetical protein